MACRTSDDKGPATAHETVAVEDHEGEDMLGVVRRWGIAITSIGQETKPSPVLRTPEYGAQGGHELIDSRAADELEAHHPRRGVDRVVDPHRSPPQLVLEKATILMRRRANRQVEKFARANGPGHGAQKLSRA